MADWLEVFWSDLLSERPMRILSAWVSLNADEQAAVRAHLRRMVTEDGWMDVQRVAAQAALDTIEDSASGAEDDDSSSAAE